MSNYSEYIEKKHRIFFRYLDLDSDGILLKKDFIKRVERLSNLNVINEEESQNTRYRWMRIGNIFFASGEEDEYHTEETWISRFRTIWTSDIKYEFSLIITGIYDVVFDRLDANRDGEISREELKPQYNNSATDRFIDEVFRKLDEDNDGRLTKNELMKAGTDFWFGEDASTGMEIMYNIHN